jgi:hypothetical protein
MTLSNFKNKFIKCSSVNTQLTVDRRLSWHQKNSVKKIKNKIKERSSVSTWRRKNETTEIIVQKKTQQDIYVIIQTLNKHKQNQQDDLKK